MKYIIWKDIDWGDYITADTFRMMSCDVVQFIINTPIGGTNPPRVVAQYNISKIIGFHEVEEEKE